MHLSIKNVIQRDKKRKDGTYRVYLRLTENRKSKFIGTPIIIKEKYWNNKKGIVKSNHDFHIQFNQRLENQRREALKQKEQLYKEDRLCLENLYAELTGSSKRNTTKTITEEIDNYHKYLKKNDRYSEWKKFGVVKNQFQEFISVNNDKIELLNGEMIEDLKSFLLNEVGNNNNTVIRKLRVFKAFTKYLRKKGYLDRDPFEFVSPPKEHPSNKTRLSIEQIEALKKLELEPNTLLWHVRNYFLFSFYNAGIRFGDLCTLQWSNIVDGKLHYQMRKSKKYKTVKLLDESKEILTLYGYPNGNRTDYIFPILYTKHTDLFSLKKDIASNNAQVNSALKEIAYLAGIEQNISTHVARHSFAQFALKKGMNMYSISKLLGHSNIQMTARYLKSFDEELVEDDYVKLFK